MFGGCCGSAPEYIKAAKLRLEGIEPRPLEKAEVPRMMLSGQ